MNTQTQRIAVLKGAISHMRCILQEPRQSVESIATARQNIAKYREELSTLEN